MTKERDIYHDFLNGWISSSDFRQRTTERWNKYVSEYRKQRENPTKGNKKTQKELPWEKVVK